MAQDVTLDVTGVDKEKILAALDAVDHRYGLIFRTRDLFGLGALTRLLSLHEDDQGEHLAVLGYEGREAAAGAGGDRGTAAPARRMQGGGRARGFALGEGATSEAGAAAVQALRGEARDHEEALGVTGRGLRHGVLAPEVSRRGRGGGAGPRWRGKAPRGVEVREA